MVHKRHVTRKQRNQRKQHKQRSRHSKKRHTMSRRIKKRSSHHNKKTYGGQYSTRAEAIDDLVSAIQEDDWEKVQEIMDDYPDITIEDVEMKGYKTIKNEISNDVRDVLSEWGFFERVHNE